MLLIAFLYPLCQHHSSDPYQQVSGLDHPVQSTHQDQYLCQPKGRHQKRIDHASRTKQPASFAENRHSPKDEQTEDADAPKPLMNAWKTDLGKETPKRDPLK